MGVAVVDLEELSVCAKNARTAADQKEAFSLRIVLADIILFSLKYLTAFIAITTALVVIGAVMYAMANGVAFIISILLNLVCSI